MIMSSRAQFIPVMKNLQLLFKQCDFLPKAYVLSDQI